MKHMAYIAAPFFNKEQIARVERLETLLERHNTKFFSPRLESNLLFEKDPNDNPAVFELNVKAIEHAKQVIVITNDKDTGTMFEAGLAFAKKKQVLYLYEGGESFNLMLSNSGIATTSIDELSIMLDKLARGGEYQKLVAQQRAKYKVF